jgi:hypothetical protein
VSTEHTITKHAADKTLTIDELRQFLEEFDKATAPEPGCTVHGVQKPKVRAGWGGVIKSITVTIPGDEKR